MNCRNCGAQLTAPMTSGRIVCTFCETVHSVIPVDDLINRVIPLNQPGVHDCLHCKCRLALAIIEEDPVEYCVSCNGALIDEPAYARIVGQHLAVDRRGDASGPLGQAARRAPGSERDEFPETRSCPGCSLAMEPYPGFGPGAGVVAGCQRCRLVWLEGEQLAALERPQTRRRESLGEFTSPASWPVPLPPSAEESVFRFFTDWQPPGD